MSCNYKVNIKDIQSKYNFKIFCAGADTTEIEQEIGNLSNLTTTAKDNLVNAINEVDGEVATKQDTLVSGTNIKTINNQSILASGNLNLEQTSNKVTTISGSSTDTQYPSAKVVYDSQSEQDKLIQETQQELDYYKTIYNVLPKVNGNGENITLNNTGESILKLDTRGQCKQDSTTGKNLLPITDGSRTIGDLAYTIQDGIFKLNGNTGSSITNNYFNVFQTNSGSAVFWLEVTGYTDKTSANSSMIIQESDDGSSNWTTFSEILLTSTQSKERNITLDSSKYYRLRFYTIDNTYTNATIKVMLEYGTTKTDWEKFTYGASPNPSYPQKIHEGSGDNTIEVCGVNIWDEEWEQGYINATGDYKASTTAIRTKNYVPIKPNTEYYVYNGTDNGGRWTYYDKDKNWIGTDTGANTSKTTPNNCYYLKFSTGTEYGGTYNNDICINVSNASINGNYYPYVSSSYNVNLGTLKMRGIGTYEDYFVRNSGKNLFDKDNTTIVSGYISGTTGNIEASDSNKCTQTYVPINSNTTYTINGNIIQRIAYYDSSNTFISATTISELPFTFTTPNNTKYIRFSGTTALNKDTIQIEKGTTATIYEPYGTGQWCKYNAIGNVVLDGSEDENWGMGSSGDNRFYYIPFTNFVYKSSVPQYGLCNLFKNAIVGSSNTTTGFFMVENSSIRFRENPIRELANWKIWLASNNLIFYYVLLTPYLSLIESETLINQLDAIEKALGKDGQTNISQVNNDTPFKIYASALMKISGE